MTIARTGGGTPTVRRVWSSHSTVLDECLSLRGRCFMIGGEGDAETNPETMSWCSIPSQHAS